MGLPFFVNCSFLIQRAIYFETAPFLWNAYLITSKLRMYGRNTSGITMLPSACW